MEQPSRFRAWVLATRPQTLTVAVAPVVVGTVIAYVEQQANWLAAGLALLGAVGIQIGTNLFNDVADYRKGADTEGRLGPPRVCANGWLSVHAVAIATWIAFGFAVAAGIGLVMLAGWPVVAIGVTSILCGLAYTGGPFPLAYLGIADLFVFIFFGLVAVAGTYFVQTGTVSAASLWAGASLGAIATGLLVVNNLRDRVTDAEVDKKTLAVRFGGQFARHFYVALVAAAYLFAAIAGGVLGKPAVALILLTLPLFFLLVRDVYHRDGRDLNSVLGGTAKAEFVFGLLFSVGVLL